jgi:hypothetical protein
MSNRDRALGELVGVGDQQVDPDRGAVERLRTEIGLPGVSSATQKRAPSMAISDDPAVLVVLR